jgi:hypothetical protein
MYSGQKSSSFFRVSRAAAKLIGHAKLIDADKPDAMPLNPAIPYPTLDRQVWG